LTRTLTWKEERNAAVIKGTRQAEVDVYETRLKQRTKRQDRLQGFYKRDLDRKQKYANELRQELNDAKIKLNAIEYGAKKAERNINVARQDLDRDKVSMSHSMAKQVEKVARLLANVQVVRATASRKEAVLAAGNRVRFLIFLFAYLFSWLAFTLQALQHRFARVVARKKQANQLKRQANKKIEKQTRLLGKTQQVAKTAIESPDLPAE